MRILLIHNHYHPEIGAVRTEHELMNEFCKQGNSVIVITTFPRPYRVSSHQILEKYRTRNFYHIERVTGNYVIIRVKSFLGKIEDLRLRILELFTSIISLCSSILLVRGNVDIVLVAGDIEFLASIPALIYSAIYKKKTIVIVHDVHPKTLIDAGIIKNNFLIGILELLEKLLYIRADKLVVHSNGNKSSLMSRGAIPEKISVVPLWADLTRIKPLLKPSSDVSKLREQVTGDFIISFAGAMTPLQGLEFIIESAKELSAYEKIKFLLVGNGPIKPFLIKKVRKHGIDNVVFWDFQPKDLYIKILQSSDICLVTLKKNLDSPSVPSKLIEIMAAGKPVIAALPSTSDASKIIERAKAGIVIDPENKQQLTKSILKLFKNRRLLTNMGKNARTYAQENFSIDQAADRYLSIAMRLCAQ